MSTSRKPFRPRSRARWLHAAVALLLALTTLGAALVPAGQAQREPEITLCMDAHKKPLIAHPGIYVDPTNCRLFFRPGHQGGPLTLWIKTNFKAVKATFPTLFGVPGEEITSGKSSGMSWRFTYQVPAGATDSGTKEILVEFADGSGAGEAIPIYTDGTGPEVEITSPQPGRVLQMPKLDVTVEGADLADPRMQPSGIQSLELFEVGTRNGQPYQTSLKQAVTKSLPYTFVKAKVSESATGLMVRAADNVGNSSDSPIVPICVESSGTCNQPPPPPPSGAPDEWTSAEPVSSLPFSQLLDTDDLSAGDSDPTCVDEEGEVEQYESSAWFKVQLSSDADVFVTTRGSTWDDGESQDPELDTVLMVTVLNNGRPSPIMCVDDSNATTEAELTFHAHAGQAYYVMAGAYYDPDDPDAAELGWLLVEMERR